MTTKKSAHDGEAAAAAAAQTAAAEEQKLAGGGTPLWEVKVGISTNPAWKNRGENFCRPPPVPSMRLRNLYVFLAAPHALILM